jgi:DNA-binding CsgD family transcriptional regulator
MAGAAGYVLKQVRGSDLVDGIRRVGRGESLLDPAVTTQVLERIRYRPEDDELAGLTDQERNILDLIAEGLTNRQIGERMYLAEKTVKNYVSNLLSKMGMSRRSEAAAYAARVAERRSRERRSRERRTSRVAARLGPRSHLTTPVGPPDRPTRQQTMSSWSPRLTSWSSRVCPTPPTWPSTSWRPPATEPTAATPSAHRRSRVSASPTPRHAPSSRAPMSPCSSAPE